MKVYKFIWYLIKYLGLFGCIDDTELLKHIKVQKLANKLKKSSDYNKFIINARPTGHEISSTDLYTQLTPSIPYKLDNADEHEIRINNNLIIGLKNSLKHLSKKIDSKTASPQDIHDFNQYTKDLHELLHSIK